MTTQYQWDINPFQDVLMQLMDSGLDISSRKVKKEINGIFVNILENVLNDPEDVVHLDFEINNSDVGYYLIGKNIVSSLWFSCVLPDDVQEVLKANLFVFDGKKYTYSKKTNKLKITKLDV